ncbi:MAG: OmpH family outer membrane protein [bacterium]
MKKMILFAFGALLFASCGNSDNGQQNTPPSVVVLEEGVVLPVAVVNTDTLLYNYDLAVEANENLIKKQEDIRLDLNQRARNLQNEVADFQKKLENSAFLSRERAESEQNRLIKKEQDLQQLEQTKTQELMIEQQNLSERLLDSINSVINHLNASGKYALIISTNSMNNNLLFCDPKYDITSEVTEILNERYNKK